MARVRVNMEGVESGFQLPAEGKHVVCVTGASIEDSKSSPGEQYIKWELTIQEGEDTGSKLWINTSLKDDRKVKSFLKGLLESMTGDEITQDDLDIDTDDYIGKYFIVTVKHKINEYQGVEKLQAVVSSHEPNL